MLRLAMVLLSFTVTLVASRAEDIRVLVSNTAGASTYDPAVGPGYVVSPEPHADLNVIWNAATQTFSGGFRTDSDVIGGGVFVQFGPEDALAYLPATGQRQRTLEGEQYNFQGPMGATYWVFPSTAPASNTNFTLYLGLSAYGVPNDGTFTGSVTSTNARIRWTVHSVENLTTPAAAAFYGYTISSGNVNMQLTLDPAYPAAEVVMLANGHTHLNLLFKAPGMYRITFRVRGTLSATGQEVSGLVPVYFGIEEWEIPPATLDYNAWRDAEFTTGQAADPLISGPDADPDRDGYSNVEEYAFGGDPLVPDAGLIRPRLQRPGGNWLLTVRQRTDASDLAITPQASSSLRPGIADWRSDLLAPTGSPRNVAPGIDEFDYLLNSGLNTNAFLRVRAGIQAAP
jgi:surface-anchored protein